MKLVGCVLEEQLVLGCVSLLDALHLECDFLDKLRFLFAFVEKGEVILCPNYVVFKVSDFLPFKVGIPQLHEELVHLCQVCRLRIGVFICLHEPVIKDALHIIQRREDLLLLH